MITFQEAIKIIRQKDKRGNQIPFDISFVTANTKTKRGGDIKELKKMIYLWPKSSGHKTNPNLYINGTINILPAGGKGITSVHLILIREINGLIVT